MSNPSVTFAVPGDIETRTGGYEYDRRLIDGLRRLGRDVEHLALGASFPAPSEADARDAAARLAAIPAGCPVIIDGLALGAMQRTALVAMSAPIVALIHHPLARESGLSTAQRDHLYRTERANLALAAHVLVPSAHTATTLCADYGVGADRITVARPGVGRPSARRRAVDPPLILSVGIQVPRKGHDILLQALSLLRDRPWHAVIVGGADHDPGHAAQLAALRDALGLGGRVRLAGRVPDEDLARLYGEATVFALATRYEGYGIVFDEAMSHGVPIVSCSVGAVPDTVCAGAGVLVPPDDAAAFARALDKVLGDAGLRASMAAAAGAAVATLPDWQDTARLVDRVLGALRIPSAGAR
jgi:glycosyltransferase involved in cell wall biosynthesis